VDVADGDVPRGEGTVRLGPLGGVLRGGRFSSVVVAELRMMIRGHTWWWYGAGLVLILTSLLVPARLARGLFMPGLWLWPVGIWSAMGAREAQTLTRALVFSAPHPLRRQLPATWLAGVLIGLAVALVSAIRPALHGDLPHLLGLGVGAVFIPSLALALGTWTNSNRAFEVVYTLLWYLGVFGRATALDFLSASHASAEAGIPAYYLAGTPILMALAVLGRRNQLRHPR
jgi:hypothetical protein